MELKGEVEVLEDRLGALEVRMEVVERLLEEVRKILLATIYDRGKDGTASGSVENRSARE
jgi:hypothetical protein